MRHFVLKRFRFSTYPQQSAVIIKSGSAPRAALNLVAGEFLLGV